MQMLFSYVIGVSELGTEWYGKAIPSIFEIQDYIEEAWDRGYNPKGRAETGGIKDTRKYIGTPEVCLLRSSHTPTYPLIVHWRLINPLGAQVQATFSSLEIP